MEDKLLTEAEARARRAAAAAETGLVGFARRNKSHIATALVAFAVGCWVGASAVRGLARLFGAA